MAQNFEQAIKDTLGDIVYQATQLRFDNERLRTELAAALAKLPKPKTVKEPRDG